MYILLELKLINTGKKRLLQLILHNQKIQFAKQLFLLQIMLTNFFLLSIVIKMIPACTPGNKKQYNALTSKKQFFSQSMSNTTNILQTKEKHTYHITCDFLNRSNLSFVRAHIQSPLPHVKPSSWSILSGMDQVFSTCTYGPSSQHVGHKSKGKNEVSHLTLPTKRGF